MKEKKPKPYNEDKESKPTDEDSMEKVKKKGSTYKFSYCKNEFQIDKKFLNKNMDIMSQLLENHNIEVQDELENPSYSSEHCHSA